MISIYVYALVSVLVVSLASLVGIFTLSLRTGVLERYLFLLVSLAAGALIGDAFIHLIPEAYAESTNPLFTSLAILAGILIFFILEKFLHWHHHHTADEEHHQEVYIHPSGKMILFSDGLHNIIDGLIIGVSYLISIEVGIATTAAVLLHEIPQEIGDFGVLLHAGYSKKRALLFNFLSALTAFIGTMIALILGTSSTAIADALVPIAAGGFVYIALTDLVPEIHKTKRVSLSALQLLCILIGIGLMVALLAIE